MRPVKQASLVSTDKETKAERLSIQCDSARRNSKDSKSVLLSSKSRLFSRLLEAQFEHSRTIQLVVLVFSCKYEMF